MTAPCACLSFKTPAMMNLSLIIRLDSKLNPNSLGNVNKKNAISENLNPLDAPTPWICGSRLVLQSGQQYDQVNDEQQNDRDFQNHHPTVGLVLLEQLVEIRQRLELAFDVPVPFTQVKTARQLLVNPCQVPVAEKFGDVRQFIVEPRQVNADFAQLAQGVRPRAQRAVG